MKCSSNDELKKEIYLSFIVTLLGITLRFVLTTFNVPKGRLHFVILVVLSFGATSLYNSFFFLFKTFSFSCIILIFFFIKKF